MNEFGQKLYNELMALCDYKDLFYFHDRVLDNITYRVFSYHYASYTDWLEPSALECRGVMFRVEGEVAVELVSVSHPKFFNIFENPLVMEPEYDKVTHFEEKADGSLMSTYLHKGNVMLKSKTSLESIMAVDAMEYLNEPENSDLKYALQTVAENGFTVIMEWCDPKPESRIVLFYETRQLRVFGIRSNITGEIVEYIGKTTKELRESGIARDGTLDAVAPISVLARYSVVRYYPDDPEAFALDTPNKAGIEGYIMVGENQRIKIKTQWYITQHRLKDSVTNEKALFCAVIAGSSDDLKSVFHDNPGAIDVIAEMENFAEPLYKKFVHDITTFHTTNKHLDRKEYAIKGQEELNRQEFGCAMYLYLGKDVDYSKIMIKNVKMYVDQYKGNIVAGTEE